MMRPLVITIGCLIATAVWLAPLAASPTAPQATVLDNGLTVIVAPTPTDNVVAVQVVIKASIADEPAGKAGLRQLIQLTSVRGTQDTSGNELATALDDMGADLSALTALDYVQFSIVCLRSDVGRAIALLADVVRRPEFRAIEVAGQREVALSQLGVTKNDPFEAPQLFMRQGLYADSAYALPTQGTDRSLPTITRSTLVAFHDQYYVPNNTIIAIAGGVDADAVLNIVRARFGDWKKSEIPTATSQPVPPLEHSTAQVGEASVGLAYFMLGYGVGKPSRTAYPVMEVTRSLMGLGMGSRLYEALRRVSASAYETDAYYFAYVGGGCLAAYVAAESSELDATRKAVLAEFQRLRTELVSATDLARAKEFAIGRHALSHQSARARAFHLAWYEAIGLGWDFDERYAEAVSAVTAAQVQAAADEYFGHYSLGLVLPRSLSSE
jgi:zinc protease